MSRDRGQDRTPTVARDEAVERSEARGQRDSRRPPRTLVFVGALLVGALLSAVGASPASGAVLFVNTLDDESSDDGDCSLREAVEAANTDLVVDSCIKGLGADLIVVLGVGTIDLTLGPLVVTDALQIQLANSIVLDAGHSSRIFEIVMSDEEHDFSLTGGTLTRGHTTNSNGGGAILVDQVDEFTVDGVTFENNRTCDLVVVTACFIDLDDPDTPPGGAISFVRDNTAAQIDHARIENSVFRGNSASGSGGAVATKEIVNSGFYILLDLIDSHFESNRAGRLGGGLYWKAAGEAVVERTAFVLNEADNSGAFLLWSNGNVTELVMRNVLVTDNVSAGNTVSVLFWGTAEIWFSTFARNTSTDPEGAAAVSISGATADHVVVADNVGGDCVFFNGITSTGYSFDSDGSCTFDHALDLPSSGAPMTGPTEFDGRLLSLPTPASPVVDGGEAVANCPGPGGGFTDQDLRGEARSAAARGAALICDVGAIERQSSEAILFADGFERGDTVPWQ